MEQFLPSYESKLLWNSLQYIPFTLIPIAGFYNLLTSTEDSWQNSTPLKISLIVIASLLTLLGFTNQWHSLYWDEPIYQGPTLYLEKTFNPGYAIFVGAFALISLAGVFVYLRNRRGHARGYTSQTTLALLVLIFPMFGSIAVWQSDRVIQVIDLLPLGSAFIIGLMSWIKSESKQTPSVDISLSFAFDYMHDPVFILDETYNTLNINRAARIVLEQREEDFVGQKLDLLFPGLFEKIPDDFEGKCPPFGFEVNGTPRNYIPEFSPISPLGSEKAGRVLVLHDITDQIQAEQTILEGEKRYRKIVEGTGAILLTVDRKGKILFANESAEKLIGVDEGETILGKQYLRFVHPDDREWVGEFYLNQFLSAVEATHIEFRIVNKAGDIRWVSFIADPWEREGEICGLTGIAQEITERKEAELGLFQSEERYALAARGANDGLWDWDLTNDHVYYSPRWETMIGCPEASVENTPEAWFSRIHAEDLIHVNAHIAKHLDGQEDHLETEYRLQHVDGSFRWMLCRGLVVRDRKGKPCRIAGSQTDITEWKLAETQLLHDAFHDSLTGLPNRTLFMDRLDRVVERSKRYPDHQYSVLFLDLDRFKEVNDQFGHSIGDMVLFELAGRMKKCIRAADTIARQGGDEFSVLLEEVKDIGDATLVAQRIQGELSLPLQLEGHEISLSASIGIVLSQSGYIDAESIMRDADIAMYRAKNNGKARFEIFDTSMRDQLFARRELENALQIAVETGQLFLQYQPVISLMDDRVTGFEALIRWNHPEKGTVSPGEFIPLAEETGLIREIDRWVLKTAAQQLAEWQNELHDYGPFSMSVNVSGKNFGDPDLVPFIREVLEETGIPPDSLHLEITESTLMENAEMSSAHLTQLKALGLEIQIDDFGTGYSSLGYLQQFPIDTIKVDRTFITRIGSTHDQREIVQTILRLAESLGMQAIAEGVETISQRDFLRSLECEFGQGFYYSAAISPDQIPTFLTRDIAPEKQAISV
jgi:diguanylate cyclase (GGDEF)-like protein/PAS domain S-box-containing protein